MTAAITTANRTAGAPRMLGKLVWTETKLFLREPVSAFFAIAFPAVLVVVLGKALPGFLEPAEDIGGRRPIDIYLPIVMALAIATVTMISLLSVLTAYRERGVLRRLSTTPVTPANLLGVQLIVNMTALVLGSVLAYVAAVTAFDVAAPANVVGFGIAFLLGSAAMCAIALLIAAVAPTSRASSAIGTVVYFPMMFFAGVWTPGPMMPDAARRIADFTPLGAASQAMQDAWSGDWPQPLHLAVMAVFTACAGAAAARFFRWH
ncbi:MAG TPA: ABC transporter permease [Micromonosporaceae bacterium]|nr:ABC transporter permease [Micromonosporaceae bacterium]